MKQEIRDKLPTWYLNLENSKLLLTNDIDSLLSCYFLHKYFNCQIKGFYDFKSIYFVENTERKNFIGIDLDAPQGRTIGNHMVWYKNENSINPNNHFDYKYYKKYPLNTVLLILSLYNVDLKEFTDEQLKVLLAIDSAYKGYYADNQHFIDVYTEWLDRLELRFLENRILKHMTITEFEAIQKKHNLFGTIQAIKGKLYTNINLGRLSLLFNDIIELPDKTFIRVRNFEYKVINPLVEEIPRQEHIFSMAWTHKNTLKMSLKTGV